MHGSPQRLPHNFPHVIHKPKLSLSLFTVESKCTNALSYTRVSASFILLQSQKVAIRSASAVPPIGEGNKAKTIGILPLNILTPGGSLAPRKPHVHERLQNPMLHSLLPSCTLEKQKRIVDPALVKGRGVAFSEGWPYMVADCVAGGR